MTLPSSVLRLKVTESQAGACYADGNGHGALHQRMNCAGFLLTADLRRPSLRRGYGPKNKLSLIIFGRCVCSSAAKLIACVVLFTPLFIRKVTTI